VESTTFPRPTDVGIKSEAADCSAAVVTGSDSLSIDTPRYSRYVAAILALLLCGLHQHPECIMYCVVFARGTNIACFMFHSTFISYHYPKSPRKFASVVNIVYLQLLFHFMFCWFSWANTKYCYFLYVCVARKKIEWLIACIHITVLLHLRVLHFVYCTGKGLRPLPTTWTMCKFCC